MSFPVPESLAAHAATWGISEWITTLPASVAGIRDRWALVIGAPFEPGGQTAWVAPARSDRFGDVVLKMAHRHEEGLDEASGLRVWDGNGAVRLYAAEQIDEETTALLLERCLPGTSLSERSGAIQDQVIASLLHRLWKEPPPNPPFRSLQQMCNWWADECEKRLAVDPVDGDPGLVRDGIALFRALPADADRTVLLVTDLHAENVLAAQREPWLMIDPKPYLGDPTYDGLQHLLNCGQRLLGDPRRLVHRFAALLEVDPDRLAAWTFARCVIESPRWPELLSVARTLRPT